MNLLYLFILGGTVNYAVGLCHFFLTRRRLATCRLGKGRIVEIAQSDSYQSSIGTPLIRYTTQEGEELQFKNRVGATSYYPGLRVDVLYEPENPQNAMINDFKTLWSLTLIGVGVGTLFWLLALGHWMIFT